MHLQDTLHIVHIVLRLHPRGFSASITAIVHTSSKWLQLLRNS